MDNLQNALSKLGQPPDSSMPQQMMQPRPQMVGDGTNPQQQQQDALMQMYKRYQMDSQAMGQQPVPIEQFIQLMQQ
jgi:hypothetical protein